MDKVALGIKMHDVAPLLKDSQWILKKADKLDTRLAGRDSMHDATRSTGLRGKALRCCLNGWHGYINLSMRGPGRDCVPPNSFLQQGYCKDKDPNCRFLYACQY